MAKKKKPSKTEKPKVSKKRAQEIEDTFQTLGLSVTQPYPGPEHVGNMFRRVSIYETEGYTSMSCG